MVPVGVVPPESVAVSEIFPPTFTFGVALVVSVGLLSGGVTKVLKAKSAPLTALFAVQVVPPSELRKGTPLVYGSPARAFQLYSHCPRSQAVVGADSTIAYCVPAT